MGRGKAGLLACGRPDAATDGDPDRPRQAEPTKCDARERNRRNRPMTSEYDKLVAQYHAELAGLQALERVVGIAKKASTIREEIDRDYWGDSEHQSRLRHELRKLYVEVADGPARADLIRRHNEISEVIRRMPSAMRIDAEVALRLAREKASRFCGWSAALLGVALVVAGHLVANLTGAIAGAVAGWFIGQGIVAKIKQGRQTAVEAAEQWLRSLDTDDPHELFQTGWTPSPEFGDPLFTPAELAAWTTEWQSVERLGMS